MHDVRANIDKLCHYTRMGKKYGGRFKIIQGYPGRLLEQFLRNKQVKVPRWLGELRSPMPNLWS